MGNCKKPRTVRQRVAALAVLGILIAVSIFIGWRALEVRQQVGYGRDEIELAVKSLMGRPPLELGQEDFETAIKHLQSAEKSLRAARDELAPLEPVLNMVGGDAAAILPLVDTALESAIAGQLLYSGLEPILDPLVASTHSNQPASSVSREVAGRDVDSDQLSDPQVENIEDLIEQLRASQPQLHRADTHLQLALKAYGRIEKKHLSADMAQSVEGLEKYSNYLASLHEFAGVLTSAPDLLSSLAGMDRPKTYLILGQNNDELRPTGGAIGTFGLLVVRDGTIVVHKYTSTGKAYLTPPTEPCPEPSPSWWIKLERPAWGCWDAQWTADFPTLARQAKWFYDQGKNDNAPVDGVIALDQIAFEQLLDAVGPVQIPGESDEVGAENFRSRVYLHPNAASYEPHKQFLSALFQAIVGRELEHIDLVHVGALAPALYEAAVEKHILLYFEDPDLEALVGLLGMDGAIQTTRGDYLFVVDTSLYDKVYDSVREQISYEARLSNSGTVSARTVITWTYSSNAAAYDPAITKATERRGQTPFLLNLTRIYLPRPGVWQSIEGDGNGAYFGVEANRLLAGTRVDVSVGESKQVAYSYLVPSAVETVDERQVYRLLVQKQPGTRGANLSVQITLPPGAELISTEPEAEPVAERANASTTVTFRARLTSDRAFQVTFVQREDNTPGR